VLFQYQKPSDIGLLPYGEGPSRQQQTGRQVVVVDNEWAATEWTPGRAARTFRFWAIALMTFTFSLGFFLVSPQLFVLTQEHPEFQMKSVLIALVLGTGGLHKGWSKFLGGMVSDRFGRERTMTMSVGLVLIGLYALNMAPAHPSAWLFFVAVFLFSTGYGFGMPVMIAAYGDLFHGPRFGSIVGCLTFAGLVGAAIGSSAGGYLRDSSGSYQAGFVLSAVAFIIAAGLMWQAKPSCVRVLREVGENHAGLHSSVVIRDVAESGGKI
jgi:MFS family permease